MARCCAGGGAPGDIYLAASQGLCRACGPGSDLVEVRYISDGKGVFLERHCPVHGKSRTLVAESLAWYLEAQQRPPAPRPPGLVVQRAESCPRACGPCERHGQRCHLPVFSITNACNLRCPICFTHNRKDPLYFMTAEEMQQQLELVIAATGSVDLVDITGGEPTLHPELLTLLALARRPEIGRIALNTNGLELARCPELAHMLAELGVYVILSLDTLRSDTSLRLHGRDIVAEKKLALRHLAEAGVQTTLLMVLVGGVNESELPELLELTLKRDHVRSLTLQTMTYTGQGGRSFGPRHALPVDAAERLVEEASRGRIRKHHFIPMPGAHFLCYGVCYLLQDRKGDVHAMTELLDTQDLAKALSDGYLLRPSDEFQDKTRLCIDRLYAEGKSPELLAAVKEQLRAAYPPGETLTLAERQRRAERRVKTIYIHAHMDEDTYEIGRAMRCPDQVPVKGRGLIGACNYNLFYRLADPHFYAPEGEGQSGASETSTPANGGPGCP